MAGVPLLIAVRQDVLPAWREFAGDEWSQLPAETDAIEAWALTLARAAA